MRALLISNGSGEDLIAAQLGRRWRERQPGLELRALALVGEGLFYQRAGIELLPPRFTPPSQGFAYLHPGLLWQDFQAGLGRHLLQSLSSLKALRGEIDCALAVGDIVAVLAASRLRAPFAFYGAALSDHYLGAAGQAGRTCYDPLQIQILKHRAALVFARDDLTAANLRRRGLDAHCDGNPILDVLDSLGSAAACPYTRSADRACILLLPGSHADAPANFALLLQQLELSLDTPRDWLAICAPQLERAQLETPLAATGWQRMGQAQWQKLASRLWLLDGHCFGQALAWADLAIGLAGTANEQCVASGLPVVAFATPGRQYNWAFGEAQQRLLGAGLSFLGDPHPLLLARQLDRMLGEPGYRAAAAVVARERFGTPGADQRMIARLKTYFGS
ncbi:MAG: lipid-A-disaccharide synthase-related protein [Candidatus Sericytochromatia bacterium]